MREQAMPDRDNISGEGLSRRSALKAGLASVAAFLLPGLRARGSGFESRENDAALRLEEADGSWRLTNLLTGDQVRLSRAAPTFDFGDFQVGGKASGDGHWTMSEERWVGEWRVGGAHPAEIRVGLEMDVRTGLLRKTAAVRLTGGSPALLRSVVVDEVDATGQSPVCRTGWQSYPALGRSFFFGVEYPVATTRVEGERVILSHAPGKRLLPGEWFHSRSAVYGATPAGRAREAFESYIAGLRPTPRGVHFNYNSWWTSPVPYTEADILQLIAAFRDNLFRPYDVSPDTFCIDMGWAKNTTLWQIDPKLFPNGFTGIAAACEGIRSRPGLWISPSGVYGQALDLAWAKQAGYEADTKACLGGPRYQAAFKRSLLDIVTRYGVGHVKFDGYVPTCDAADHGHAPGALSAEAIADGIIDVFQSLRKAAPNLWIEPTCFGFDPSPWWLAYCHSVIGTFGDDAPHGRVPCPVYRESYTTGRDYFNLKGARDILAPIAAQEVLGIIHQTPEPLYNDAVTAALRGHQFLPLYIHPKYMTPRRWEFLAALMLWARQNADVLANTRPILPASWRKADGKPSLSDNAPMPREPYGYAHWKGDRGLLCLRNPWIEPAAVTIRPDTNLGAPPDASGMAAFTIYPERRLLATGMRAADPLTIPLAPYETAVIEFDLRVGVLPPRARKPEPLPAVRLNVRASRCEPTDAGPEFGPDYTRLLAGNGPFLRLRLSGGIMTSGGGRHEWLLLIEGPDAVAEPLCSLQLNGKPVTCRVICSETGWRATGATAPEHWLWLTAPLPGKESRVEADIMLTDPAQRVTGWVAQRQVIPWRKMAKVDGSQLPAPEERWLSSVRAFDTVALTDRLTVERGEGPVQRIHGVYLDTLEPLSVTQGWGTLQRNRSVWEKPMTVGGRRFRRGLGTHAPSRIVYALDGRYRRFTAWAGADQATAPTITMEVKVDGKTVWKSGLLTRESPAQRVDVSIAGAKRLELLAGDGGNGLMADHADWADAALLF
jgi:hypothetical protein